MPVGFFLKKSVRSRKLGKRRIFTTVSASLTERQVLTRGFITKKI